LVAFGASSTACSDARQPPQPASFDRPTDVDFVCIKERGGGLRDVAELAECDFIASDRALHALVTQSARGEVAAVNLSTERILDNRRDIPGYTFVGTGELPIAITVSELHPQITYVASYGSRDVRVMRTRVLVGLTSEEPDLQIVPLTIDAADGGTFGGTPSDMVLLPGERVLLVTLSDVGKVARLPLDAEGLIEEDDVTFIDLPVVSPAAPVATPIDEPYAKYCGGYQPPPMPAVKPRSAPPAATTPRPIALALDRTCRDNGGCRQGRVLIADEALPVMHVLDIEALRAGTDPVLDPIPTGVPTRDVVVTPSVPDKFVALKSNEVLAEEEKKRDEGEEVPPPPTVNSTYFVYAIDAIDGSVLVLQNDRLLAINRDPNGQADRLPLESRNGAPPPLALALEVLTPRFSANPSQGYEQWVEDYEPGADAVSTRRACTDDAHTTITPRRLRGVFLSVAMADGTVRIVDVHDRDLRACRDCDGNAADNDHESGNSDNHAKAPIVVRHHPRLVTDPIAMNEADREELRPDTNASVTVRTGPFNIRNNGSVASPLSPSFGCFECAEGFEQALPDPDDQAAAVEEEQMARDASVSDEDAGADGGVAVEGICRQALVCAPSDPWAAPPTTYAVGYEAAVPNTAAGDGEFVGPDDERNVTGLLEVHSGVAFCGRGVLGRDDIGGAQPEAACAGAPEQTPGDQLVILSEVLSDAALVNLKRNRRERDVCARVREKLEEDESAALGFEIIAAFEDRVAIRSQLSDDFGQGQFNLGWREWDEDDTDRQPSLQSCLGDARIRFFVRSTQSFLVTTGREGFAHNVIANGNGRCVVDAMSGPERSRRTWTGCEYKDDRIQFQIEPFDYGGTVVQEPGDGYLAVIQFGIATTSAQLVLNATQIGFGVTTLVPARLRYSSTDERLYLVDTYQGGLIPIDLDPFTDTPITSFY
jgi:hypothetical protein